MKHSSIQEKKAVIKDGMIIRYDGTMVTSKNPMEAGELVFYETPNILRNNDLVQNVRNIPMEEVYNFWKIKCNEPYCIHKRDQEMQLIEQHNIPFYCYYYELKIVIDIILYQFKFVFPQINGIALDTNTGNIRIMDLYSQLKRFDLLIHFKQRSKNNIYVTLHSEFQVPDTELLPKFLKTPFFKLILEKLNILHFQKAYMKKMMMKQIVNNIQYFTRLGLMVQTNNHPIHLQTPTPKGFRFPGGYDQKEDLWEPCFISS